jgi:nitrogen regulatory protein P-II 1
VKQLLAIVRPHVAEKVVEALRRAPVEAFTVREVKGYGRQKDQLAEYGQTEFELAFLPKIEIAIWVDDPRVEEVVSRITATAGTGRMGDGKVMILPVARFEQVINIADR